jgi:hypothetical protein
MGIFVNRFNFEVSRYYGIDYFQESWVEIKQSAHNRSADTGREQENVILHKLYDHVASSVTKPLREDLNLRLDDLVTQEEVREKFILKN